MPGTRGATLKKADQARLLEAVERSGSIRRACKETKLSRSVVYRARDNDPKLREALAEASEAGVEEAEAVLQERALSGMDTVALIFFLKNRKPQVYAEGRLRHQEKELVRAEARQEVLAEYQAELDKLTPKAQEALLRLLPEA